jgi:hypothetical protein
MKGVKPQRHSLIPTEALDLMAQLYGFGEKKYDAHNWRKGYDWSKSYDSLIRHANAFWSGEDNDPETQLPHMASVAWHAFTLMIFMIEHPELDDRYKDQINEVMENPYLVETTIWSVEDIDKKFEKDVITAEEARERYMKAADFPPKKLKKVILHQPIYNRPTRSIIIPECEGVDYRTSDGPVLPAGSYPLKNTEQIEAYPKEGYYLDPQVDAVWLFAYPN